jgi:EmrB/QacA subfamily drug resistance transporter
MTAPTPSNDVDTADGPALVRRVGLTLALGGLLVIIDTTIAVVATPAIIADLRSDLPTVQFVTIGYVLAIVAVIPLSGWLATRWGAKRVYLVALAAFTSASLLCSVAWNIESLIAFRVLQGLGGGLINPLGQAIALRTAPRESKGRVMSLLGLPVVVGPVLGPLVAGALVDAASWRSIFIINIPLGILAFVLCRRVLPADSASSVTDLRGATAPERRTAGSILTFLLVPLGGASLVLGSMRVSEAGQIDLLGVAMIATGLLVIAGSAAASLRDRAAILQLRVLEHRPLALGAVILLFFCAGFFGTASILPVLVQGVRGDSALMTGALEIPMALATGLVLQLATRMIDRRPPWAIVVPALAVSLVGLVALGWAVSSNSSYGLIIVATVILGAGAGAVIMPTMTMATRDLDGDDISAATTILAMVTQLAGAIGAAITAGIMTQLLNLRVDSLDGGGVGELMRQTESARTGVVAEAALATGTSYAFAVVMTTIALGLALRLVRSSPTPR